MRAVAPRLAWRAKLVGVAKELRIGFVSWSPLGVGFLTDAIKERTRFADGDICGIKSR